MKLNLILALFISTLAIGGASASRFMNKTVSQPSIVVAEQPSLEAISPDEMFLDLVKATTTDAGVSSEPLTNTDLLGQQLITDYIDLATKGQATDANLAALAGQYVELIPSLNTALTASFYDLEIVPNNQLNFQSYADSVTEIRNAYGQNLNAAYLKEQNSNNPNSNMNTLTKSLSEIYTNTASRLRNLPVPNSLVSAHLKLVNHYYSNASALKAISESDKDASSAFAGIISLNNNINEEEIILNDITKILTNNGL